MKALCLLIAIPTLCLAEEEPIPQVPVDVIGVYPTEFSPQLRLKAVQVERGWEHVYHPLFLEWISFPDNPNEQSKIIRSLRVKELGSQWVLGAIRWEKNVLHVTGVFTMNPKVEREFLITPEPDGGYTFKGDPTLSEDDLPE